MSTSILAQRAKMRLEALVVEMDRRLDIYWQEEIELNFGFNEAQKELVNRMLVHAREHNLRSGKRLRGSLVIAGYELSGKKADERVWRAAMAVEIVHTALLMHDDFMDEDKLRRGKPTTHEFWSEGDKHYGEAMAVNIGDAVLCLGYEMLARCGFDDRLTNKAMVQLLRGITNTAYGQAFDVSLPKLKQLTEENVLCLHRAKTAIYTYENPLVIGAILGELGEEIIGKLKEYSEFGGVAFQLQDDVLGVFGDEEKTGKSSDSDLLQGKVTLLAVVVLAKSSAMEIDKFRRVWGNTKASRQEIDEVKKNISEGGSYKYSVELARSFAIKAVNVANKMRSLGLDAESLDYLEGIAQYMVERDL